MTVDMRLGADTEMLERVCESGSDHWRGTVAEMRSAAVSVSPAVMQRYVGIYAGIWAGAPRQVDVALADGQLVIRINDDPEALPLTPLSDTLFQSADNGYAYDFVSDSNGPATDVVEIHVSGGYKFSRRQK
jgi:hypothetical protein